MSDWWVQGVSVSGGPDLGQRHCVATDRPDWAPHSLTPLSLWHTPDTTNINISQINTQRGENLFLEISHISR